jgi:hypothetical protein
MPYNYSAILQFRELFDCTSFVPDQTRSTGTSDSAVACSIGDIMRSGAKSLPLEEGAGLIPGCIPWKFRMTGEKGME